MPLQPPRQPEQRLIRISLDGELGRVQANHDRIGSLMVIYDSIVWSPRSSRDDLLRAQVVFIHATLEDFLRSVGALRLPTCGPEKLEGIPLAPPQGGDIRRSEKFTLGDLSHHRFRTVFEVIDDSVRSFLAQESFGSTSKIDAFLTRCNLTDHRAFLPYYLAIDSLIKRRHQIVHRADFPDDDGSEPEPITGPEPAPITKAEVVAWLHAVRDLTVAIAHAHTNQFGSARSIDGP